MIYCINKCNRNCERKLSNRTELNGEYCYGRLEGFPSLCPKSEGAPVDETDAPEIRLSGIKNYKPRDDDSTRTTYYGGTDGEIFKTI